MVEDLLQQPILVIAGSKAESLWMSTELHGRVRAPGKEFLLLEGATHMALYDDSKYVGPAAAKAAEFFGTYLAAK